VRALLAHGARSDRIDRHGRTPLLWAAQGGFVDIIKALVAHGADCRRCDDSGDSALTLAAWHGHVTVVDVIASFSDVN
ncbi:hypothetical protein GH868_30875, partial [Bacillus thuringiensis]|nr:hypothetical protein [Bacillus thuringiensis]